MARTRQTIHVSTITPAKIAALEQTMKEAKEQEKKLNAACVILGIDLSTLLEVKGDDLDRKMLERKRILSKSFKKAQLAFHTDKNPGEEEKAGALTRLCNAANQLLKDFIEADCVIRSDAAFQETFSRDYREARKKFKTQYTYMPSAENSDAVIDSPWFWRDVAKAGDATLYLRKNWDNNPKKTVEDGKQTKTETANPVSTKNKEHAVEVYSEAKFIIEPTIEEPVFEEFYGPEAFFQMLITDSLPRSFGQAHLRDAITLNISDDVNATGYERRRELLKKCLTTPAALLKLDSKDLLRLAKDATAAGIITFGKSDQETFLYYLKHFPQTLYTKRIKNIMGKLNVDSIVDVILKDISILNQLSSQSLLELVKSSGRHQVRLATAILRDPILSSHLRDYQYGYSDKLDMIEIILDADVSLDAFTKFALKEILYGNTIWLTALSEHKAQEITEYLKGYGIDIKESSIPVSLQTSAKQYALKLLYTKENQHELSYFNPEFLINEFKDDHYQFIHVPLAGHISQSDPKTAKKLLKNIIEKHEKEKKEAPPTELDPLLLKASRIVRLNRLKLIENYISYLNKKFIDYLKDPHVSPMLDKFIEQYSFLDNGQSLIDGEIEKIKGLIKNAIIPVFFQGKSITILEDVTFHTVDDISIFFEKIKNPFDDGDITEELLAFLEDKIKEFARLENEEHVKPLQTDLNEAGVEELTLIDIQKYMIRLLGEKEGSEKFSQLMFEHLPGVRNLKNPDQEIKQSMIARAEKIKGDSSKSYSLIALKEGFSKKGFGDLSKIIYPATLKTTSKAAKPDLSASQESPMLAMEYFDFGVPESVGPESGLVILSTDRVADSTNDHSNFSGSFASLRMTQPVPEKEKEEEEEKTQSEIQKERLGAIPESDEEDEEAKSEAVQTEEEADTEEEEETEEDLPTLVYPPDEIKADFSHYYFQNQEFQLDRPYKIRINIRQADYTEKKRDNILNKLIDLTNQYFPDDNKLISEMKCFRVSKDEIKNKIQFWKYIKKNDLVAARNILENFIDPSTRDRYEVYLSGGFTEKVINERILEHQQKLNIDQAQFTLYLNTIDFNSNEPVILLKFLRAVDTYLKWLNIKPGSTPSTDSKGFSFFSFQNAPQLPREEKKVNLCDVVKSCIHYPESYIKMWDQAGEEPVDKVLAILNDYTKGDGIFSNVSLFFTGHVFFGQGRHHTTEVRNLIERIQNESLQIFDVLCELDKITKKNKFNFGGSLYRRMTFINEMCKDHYPTALKKDWSKYLR